MFTLYLSLAGLAAFVIGTVVLGLWLRRHPTKDNAEKSSRVMHFLFFAGLVVPGIACIFYPGLRQMDGVAGLDPLPWRPFFLAAGVVLAIPGLYFLGVSNKLLRALGSGTNAFRLTKRVVEQDAYRYTRNPMSFGYYLFALGLGFIFGSTLITLAVLVGLVPAHVFFLKYFEELELELRFGESYKEYKHKTPFLIPRISAGRLTQRGGQV